MITLESIEFSFLTLYICIIPLYIYLEIRHYPQCNLPVFGTIPFTTDKIPFTIIIIITITLTLQTTYTIISLNPQDNLHNFINSKRLLVLVCSANLYCITI